MNFKFSNFLYRKEERKVVSNFSSKSLFQKIGVPTNIFDMNKKQIFSGNSVRFIGKTSIMDGVILFVKRLNKFCFCSGKENIDGDIYNEDSYWNIIPIDESFSNNLVLI